MGAATAQADEYLYDWAVNINGPTRQNQNGDVFPLDTSNFNLATDLGTTAYTNAGAAENYNFVAFFDHDGIWDAYDETGAAIGSPSVGQSWKIDHPGYNGGTIYNNVLTNTLDNTYYSQDEFGNQWGDLSMAIGCNYQLLAGRNVIITLDLSTTKPSTGFYPDMQYNDPLNNQPDIYFTESLKIATSTNPVLEPPTIILLLFGLIGLLWPKWPLFRSCITHSNSNKPAHPGIEIHRSTPILKKLSTNLRQV
ncbi:MAG: hypothetical protein ACP5IL_07205 [Syntrophobacteraceae bacterium]